MRRFNRMQSIKNRLRNTLSVCYFNTETGRVYYLNGFINEFACLRSLMVNEQVLPTFKNK